MMSPAGGLVTGKRQANATIRQTILLAILELVLGLGSKAHTPQRSSLDDEEESGPG